MISLLISFRFPFYRFSRGIYDCGQFYLHSHGTGGFQAKPNRFLYRRCRNGIRLIYNLSYRFDS